MGGVVANLVERKSGTVLWADPQINHWRTECCFTETSGWCCCRSGALYSRCVHFLSLKFFIVRCYSFFQIQFVSDAETGHQNWPGVIQFLELCASSDSPVLRETGMILLEWVAITWCILLQSLLLFLGGVINYCWYISEMFPQSLDVIRIDIFLESNRCFSLLCFTQMKDRLGLLLYEHTLHLCAKMRKTIKLSNLFLTRSQLSFRYFAFAPIFFQKFSAYRT